MIYLLAVIDEPDAAVRALSAVTDRDISLVCRHPVACIGVGWSGALPEPGAESLRSHDRMVQSLMRVGAVVPFRFATVVADASEVDAWLGERTEELISLLAQLRGRVEMAVRASVAGGPDQPEARTGRGYLEALRRERTAEPALAGVHRDLSAAAAGSVLSVGDRRRVTGSYLVDAGRVDSFRERAERLASESPEIVSFSVTGPWAPYSFVGTPAEAPLAGAGAPSRGRPHA